MTLWSLIVEDLKTQREGIFAQGFWAILVYRISHPRMNCRVGIVRKPWALFNIVMQKLIEMTCGITLPEGAKIGRRLRIEHYGSIIVHGSTIIGNDCLIRQGVTLGNKGDDFPGAAPSLGDRVEIGAGAKLIGNIKVSDDVKIGANAVVTCDLPSGCIAVGVPARIVQPRVNDIIFE
ncbi:hypothetical protein [Asticcacaulis sp.]|uniref:serine O-acetyltransferase n=1 Tax=Asticcacaulis sp. TaxID=1872648 RepID=UPI0031DC95CA